MSALPWHGPAWQELMRESARFPPALLIRGRSGIGKLAFARAAANALLCESARDSAPACGRCPGCLLLAAGNHPDYRELVPESIAEDAAGGPAEADEDEAADGGADGDAGGRGRRKPRRDIHIEQVRALGELTRLGAHRGGRRVAIVHPAEAMNRAAANALLKTLEEPPPGVVLMLVAHRAALLPPTIVSRCRPLALPVPAPDRALAWLRERGCAQPELRLALAGGAPLAALELDGESYWQARAACVAALSRPGFDPLAAAAELRAIDPPRLLVWLQQWLYDIASLQAGGAVRYHVDCGAALARAARRMAPLAVLRLLRALVRRQRTIGHPLNARLLIERLLIDYAALAAPAAQERAA